MDEVYSGHMDGGYYSLGGQLGSHWIGCATQVDNILSTKALPYLCSHINSLLK